MDRRRGRCFLAAAHQGDSGDHGKGMGFGPHVHGNAPFKARNSGMAVPMTNQPGRSLAAAVDLSMLLVSHLTTE